MKRSTIRFLLSHACVIVSLMIVVFFCIDRVNTSMEFMTSEISKWVILLLAVLSFANAFMTISGLRRALKKQLLREAALEETALAETEGADGGASENGESREVIHEDDILKNAVFSRIKADTGHGDSASKNDSSKPD